jgi:hypothetical protein
MKSIKWIVLGATAGLAFSGVASGLNRLFWPPGGGSVNGLLPSVYRPNRPALNAWLFASVPTSSVPPLPASLASLASVDAGSAQGKTLIEDTLDCTLPAGTPFFDPSIGLNYPSKGLMRWPSWPSSDSATEPLQVDDVHTCLTTRLNYFGDPIQIYLSGPHVVDQSNPPNPLNDANSYPYAEAVWVANTAGGEFNLDVWPLDDLTQSCQLDKWLIEQQIKRRVCGSPNSPCGIHVRYDLDVCTTGNGWVCPTASGPRAAIATRLGPCAWKKLYIDPGADNLPSCGKGIAEAPDCSQSTTP